VLLLEAVGDVIEKDETKHHVLVFSSIHVAPELVTREPEFLLKADVGGVVWRFTRFRPSHESAENSRNLSL